MSNSKIEKRIYDEKFMELLMKAHGTKCANCGGNKDVEYHHIVPLTMGGTNAISNFIPLCYICHKKSHGYKIHMERIRKKSNGRPSKICSNYDEIFDQYKSGKIGSSEVKKLLGISQKTHFTEHVLYKQYLEKNGIKYIKNNIDIILKKNGYLFPGRSVGHIEFVNEDILEIRYSKKDLECNTHKENKIDSKIIFQFACGKIGENELKNRLHIKFKNIYEDDQVSDWCKYMGIEKINNYVDDILSGKIKNHIGQTISEIHYQNGRIERFLIGLKNK